MSEPATNDSIANGTATIGRLVFMSGAAGVAITADPTLPDLYRARFAHHPPSVRVEQSTVILHYRHFRLFDWLADVREPLAEVLLNGSIPWELEFRGGVSKLTADLRGLLLRSLDLSSASQVLALLPQPVGTVFIHIAGSASNVAFYRPAGVAIRAQISGSTSDLTLDMQRPGAVAGDMRWQTPDYNHAANRYDIRIAGSASHVSIMEGGV